MGKIIIHLKSQSIGDTIASVPYISRFQETNSADEVYASINDYLIQYFTLKYPNIIFLGRDYNIGPARTIYLEYSIGSSLTVSLSLQQARKAAPACRQHHRNRCTVYDCANDRGATAEVMCRGHHCGGECACTMVCLSCWRARRGRSTDGDDN